MKNLFIILVLFSFFGCREKVESKPEPKKGNSIQLSDSLEVETNRVVTLLPEARELVSAWLAYATAENGINSMKKATGFDLVQISRPMVQIMENLHSSMPDTLKVPAVLARTNVLKTKANVLHQLSSQKNVEPQAVFETSNDLIMEFGNFKIQLNEMFMKTLEDFETELDLQFKEAKDSINKAQDSVEEKEV
ncbi:MAG TPA: hypothetical protein VFM59_04250 [Salinimicrobium sp.]|nr:hypothetical protein [Salinimicrobium sp.]